MTEPRELLRIEGLTKSFPGVRALAGVSLSVRSGEIVAIVGQNGSGKSTLVKCLAGIYQQDAGTIEVAGPAGGLAQHRSGQVLQFIHQDLGLISGLDTVENMSLGQPLGWRWILPAPVRAEKRQARELVRQFSASFDVRAPIADLTAAERAIVAIARALERAEDAARTVLVLDEPTASLHGREVGELFEAIRAVPRAGGAVIFISHRLDEVLALADRVVALRDGHKVADVERAGLERETLIEAIAGHAVSMASGPGESRAGEVVLTAESLWAPTVRDVSLSLRRGEVVGLTGLLGSGREELARVLFGAARRRAGRVTVGGRVVKANSAKSAIRAGMAFSPADRRGAGAVMTMNVRENITLPSLEPVSGRFWRLRGRDERRQATDWIAELDIRPPDPDAAIALLSGGNQQKVVVAKWLRTKPAVFLLDEPTQGVDVEAKAAIHALLRKAAAAGTAVLVSSSDTQELVTLCDRVLVMRDGTMVAELMSADLSEARLISESLSSTAPDDPGGEEIATDGAHAAGGTHQEVLP